MFVPLAGVSNPGFSGQQTGPDEAHPPEIVTSNGHRVLTSPPSVIRLDDDCGWIVPMEEFTNPVHATTPL